MATINRSIADIEMPDRVKALPVSQMGFPVPWFVAWIGDDGQHCEPGQGVPDFRIMDGDKFVQAVRQHRCWICGQPMGTYKAFVIGSMCAINRVIGEPPSHKECAVFAARACPFLSQPRMVRNRKRRMPQAATSPPAGFHLDRNPGVACVWITKAFHAFKPHAGGGGILFSLGPPTEVQWFCNGRRATRAEVLASIDRGFPALLDIARQEGSAAIDALNNQKQIAIATVVPA